tara:strand:+ start:3617 stop:5533 length:1917 start_codon:yes stop_codon:yes gene_type:complete
MATSFGYVREDREDRVNWAQIGKDASQLILDERQRRLDEKERIRTESKEFNDELYDAIPTDNNLIRTAALDMANLMSAERLQQDRDLQDGILSVRDYTIQRQNLYNTAEMAADINSKKSKAYELYIKAVNEGNLSPESSAVKAYYEQFTSLDSFGLQLDPSGNGYFTPKIFENGVVVGYSEDPKDFVGMKGYQDNLFALKPAVNLEDDKSIVNMVVGAAAETWKIAGGGFKTVQDAWQNESYQLELENIIRGQLVNPDVASAIAGKYFSNYEYEFLIGGQKSKGGDVIPLRINPSSGQWQFDMESEQGQKVLDDVVQMIKNRARAKMNRTETPYSASEIKTFDEIKTKKKDKEEVASQLFKLQQGDADEVKAAVRFFEGNNNITNFTIVDNGTSFTYDVTDADGNTFQRQIDRSVSPDLFFTQVGEKFSEFSLGDLKGTKIFKKLKDNTLVDASNPDNQLFYSNLSAPIEFEAINVTPPDTSKIKSILTDTYLKGETITSVKQRFKDNFDLGFEEAMNVELTSSGVGSAQVVGEDGKFAVINIPNVTAGNIVIRKDSEDDLIRAIAKIQDAAKKGGKVSNKDMMKIFNISLDQAKVFYRTITGADEQAVEDAFGAGSVEGAGNTGSGGIDGSQFNNEQ